MKLVFTGLAKVDIAHQATRDSIPISFFVLILLLPPLIIIEFMVPSVETKLTHNIIACRNSAVPLPVKPICKKSALQSALADSVWLHSVQIFIYSICIGEITGHLWSVGAIK
jgi:hypothetical protein